MLVLITYDVNTEDPAGRKRLRQIARQWSRQLRSLDRLPKMRLQP